jgi:phospholipid/cholesterol/gamma-HCH transport system substrate-binding protein
MPTVRRKVRQAVKERTSGDNDAGRIMTMALFALSVFAIGMFLWISFGGQLPLKPQGYRFKLPLTDGPNLVTEADVRISGVNVGKVKTEELDKGGARSLAVIEIEEQYAPIPADTKAILREKTLLGESYIELSPGSASAPTLKENTTLPQAQVDESVQFDEILRIFDPETKQAYREWMAGTALASRDGAGEDLNDALGNLAPFAVDGADLLEVLNSQRSDLKSLINNTGKVFGALSEGDGILRSLIVNSEETFEALAAEQESLEETFRILPTFLDESRRTVNRLDRFARNTNPLVTRLKPVAADLPPTLRDLGRLSPDLRQLFIDLRPLIREAPETLPDGARFLRGLTDEGVVKALHTFFPEVNPILSFTDYSELTLLNFLSNGSAGLSYRLGPATGGKGDFKGRPNAENGLGTLAQWGVINDESLSVRAERPEHERGNAYPEPNYIQRVRALGIFNTWDCKPNGGEQRSPREDDPPCFVEPDSLFDGNKYPRLERGERSRVRAPRGNEPCNDPSNPLGSLGAGCRDLGGSPYRGG